MISNTHLPKQSIGITLMLLAIVIIETFWGSLLIQIWRFRAHGFYRSVLGSRALLKALRLPASHVLDPPNAKNDRNQRLLFKPTWALRFYMSFTSSRAVLRRQPATSLRRSSLQDSPNAAANFCKGPCSIGPQ